MNYLNFNKEIDWVSKTKGFAILCVVICHVSQQFDIHNGITRMADAGRYGVQLFFVISAFLVFVSLYKHPVDSWKAYFKFMKRKVVRLLPILWTAIFWNVINYSKSIGHIPTIADDIWKRVFFSSLLINGFSYQYFNSWMTWYIGVYVIFVATAPLLYKFIDSPKKAILFFVCSAVSGWLLNFLLVCCCGVLSDDWFFYGWLPRQLPVFSLGIILYHFTKANAYPNIKYSVGVLAFVMSIGFILSFCAFTSPLEIHVRYGVLLLIFSLTLFSRKWKCLNWLCTFGNNSYGIYLFHGCLIGSFNLLSDYCQMNRESLLIFLLYFVLLSYASYFVSLAVSSLIEKPILAFAMDKEANYSKQKQRA